MTKQQLSKELQVLGVEFSKIIFHKQSPYQKRRYKPEFIEWEAWLYNGKSNVGFLLSQSDYENKEYLSDYLLAFKH